MVDGVTIEEFLAAVEEASGVNLGDAEKEAFISGYDKPFGYDGSPKFDDKIKQDIALLKVKIEDSLAVGGYAIKAFFELCGLLAHYIYEHPCESKESYGELMFQGSSFDCFKRYEKLESPSLKALVLCDEIVQGVLKTQLSLVERKIKKPRQLQICQFI